MSVFDGFVGNAKLPEDSQNLTFYFLEDIGFLFRKYLTVLPKICSGGYKAKELVSKIYKDLSVHNDKKNHVVVLNFDGMKDDSFHPMFLNSKEDLYVENIDDILVNDDNFPSFNVWYSNKRNVKFRKKIYEYITDNLRDYWTLNQKCLLYMTNCYSNDEHGTIRMRNNRAEFKKDTNYGSTIQVCFKFIEEHSNENSVFIIRSNECSYFAYGILHQLKLKSNIFVQQKNKLVSIRDLKQTIEKINFSSTDIFSKVDWSIVYLIVHCLLKNNKLVTHVGAATKKSKAFRFDEELFFQNIHDEIKTTEVSIYSFSNNEIMLDTKLILSLINKFKRKNLTKKQQHAVSATLNKCQWCINYMLNPCNDKYSCSFLQYGYKK